MPQMVLLGVLVVTAVVTTAHLVLPARRGLPLMLALVGAFWASLAVVHRDGLTDSEYRASGWVLMVAVLGLATGQVAAGALGRRRSGRRARPHATGA